MRLPRVHAPTIIGRLRHGPRTPAPRRAGRGADLRADGRGRAGDRAHGRPRDRRHGARGGHAQRRRGDRAVVVRRPPGQGRGTRAPRCRSSRRPTYAPGAMPSGSPPCWSRGSPRSPPRLQLLDAGPGRYLQLALRRHRRRRAGGDLHPRPGTGPQSRRPAPGTPRPSRRTALADPGRGVPGSGRRARAGGRGPRAGRDEQGRQVTDPDQRDVRGRRRGRRGVAGRVAGAAPRLGDVRGCAAHLGDRPRLRRVAAGPPLRPPGRRRDPPGRLRTRPLRACAGASRPPSSSRSCRCSPAPRWAGARSPGTACSPACCRTAGPRSRPPGDRPRCSCWGCSPAPCSCSCWLRSSWCAGARARWRWRASAAPPCPASAGELVVESLLVAALGAASGLAVTRLLARRRGLGLVGARARGGRRGRGPVLGAATAAARSPACARVPANRTARRTAAQRRAGCAGSRSRRPCWSRPCCRSSPCASAVSPATTPPAATSQRRAPSRGVSSPARWSLLRLLPPAAALGPARHTSLPGWRRVLRRGPAHADRHAGPARDGRLSWRSPSSPSASRWRPPSGRASRHGALSAVGGDARLELQPDPALTETAGEVAGAPGVAAAAAGRVEDGVRIVGAGRCRLVRLVVVDAAAYEQLLAVERPPRRSPAGPAASRRRRTGCPPCCSAVPTGCARSPTCGGRTPSSRWRWSAPRPMSTPLPPGRRRRRRGPRRRRRRGAARHRVGRRARCGRRPRRSRSWRTALESVTSYADDLERRRDAALPSAMVRLAAASSLLLLVLAMLGTVLAAATEARARAESIGRLRALGLQHRDLRRVLVGELVTAGRRGRARRPRAGGGLRARRTRLDVARAAHRRRGCARRPSSRGGRCSRWSPCSPARSWWPPSSGAGPDVRRSRSCCGADVGHPAVRRRPSG